MIDTLRAIVVRRRRFLTFCAVGGSGVAVNMVVYLLALGVLEDAGYAGLRSINAAAFLGWFVSVASNFVLNDRLTFRSAETGYASAVGHRLARYYASASVAFAIQAAVLNGLLLALDDPAFASIWQDATERLDALGIPMSTALKWRRTTANLIGIGVATVANYLLARNWVFRKTNMATTETHAP